MSEFFRAHIAHEKGHPSETPENQGFPPLFFAENTNVPIPGYLYSMKYTEESARLRDKPVWEVDICAALPDDRTVRGGAAE